MTTIITKREDEGGDVSFALGRCADKISLLKELFVSAESPDDVHWSNGSYQGLSWLLGDIEDDLRFLDENYRLKKRGKKEETGEEVV